MDCQIFEVPLEKVLARRRTGMMLGAMELKVLQLQRKSMVLSDIRKCCILETGLMTSIKTKGYRGTNGSCFENYFVLVDSLSL